MAEYSRLAKGVFTSSGGAQVINLPFVPDFVEFINVTAVTTPTTDGIPMAWWDSNMQQGTAIVDIFDATPVLTMGHVDVNGISTFRAGQLLQYGPSLAIDSITRGNPTLVTTTADHGLKSGDVIIMSNLYQTAVTGFQQIAGIPFTITVTGDDTFTICWNTNQSEFTIDYSALTATQAATYKKVLYPYLYFPGTNFICDIQLGQTTTVDTTTAHNFVVGQEVAFRVPTIWGTQQLNSLPNIITPGSPIYGYVIEVIDYNTVVVDIDSTAFTAFDSNQPFLSFPGLSFPQIVAVGDVNTGGVQISFGSQLYPPPYYTPIGDPNDPTRRFNTINGPAIQGAYVNNTSQGFIIGSGSALIGAVAVPGSSLVGIEGDEIFWRAYLHDINVV